jgi:hypothetical protein
MIKLPPKTFCMDMNYFLVWIWIASWQQKVTLEANAKNFCTASIASSQQKVTLFISINSGAKRQNVF